MVFKKFDENQRESFAPRKMIKGDWNCSDCKKEITELPFQPSPDRPIYCRDCWAKKRTQKFER